MSKMSLSRAIISSMHMISLTAETQVDRGGVVVVFQKRGISCLAADRKKRSRVRLWEATEPGSIDNSAIAEDGIVGRSYRLLYMVKT